MTYKTQNAAYVRSRKEGREKDQWPLRLAHLPIYGRKSLSQMWRRIIPTAELGKSSRTVAISSVVKPQFVSVGGVSFRQTHDYLFALPHHSSILNFCLNGPSLVKDGESLPSLMKLMNRASFKPRSRSDRRDMTSPWVKKVVMVLDISKIAISTAR